MKEVAKKPGFGTKENAADDKENRLLGRGGFCPLLEEDVAARLFLSFDHDKKINLSERKTEVLSQILQGGPGKPLHTILRLYDPASKDKVMLAYAIARSSWQYYDSELMRTRWTSDTIWFMPEDDDGKHKGQLPRCTYLSFPFDVSGNIMPDIIDEGLLNHRCPRIFDIGVLLLEIGLGTPFQRLLELQKTEWGNFTKKQYFDLTVEFCLNSEYFVSRSKQLRPVGGGPKICTARTSDSDWRQDISTRKKIFYQNVVRPLEWLAKGKFKAQARDITYVSEKPDSSLPRGMSDATPQPEPEALFHSGIDSRMWLQGLKRISEYVERKRRDFEVAAPVRIAILDTGCDQGFTAFQARSKQFAVGKDFVDPSATNMTDTFGHGTLMTRLIIECAPGAEIIVVRVAQNTKKLKESQKNIKEAILWASRHGKADIISMSFGFPDDDQGIREAIETVQKERQEHLPEVKSIVEKNRSFLDKQKQSFGTKLFAKFLDIANANVGMSLRNSKNQSFGTVDHQIRAFNKAFTPETLKAIVALDNVKRHIDSGRFGKRYVYIISGIRVAQKSFAVTDEQAGKSYETAPGIVFAYRLHVIRSKTAGEEGELFSHRTAFFSGEAEDEAEEIEIAEVNRAVLRGDLDEPLDGYSEEWFGEIDDEAYVMSANAN
ncbi:hypothetical protein MKX08_002050 [Trichoderma sp. CBMAI-0020]|nr:hypothetical protein MKX08_002050 [Trichoderma sp. CBMAI-0020]